MTFIVAPDGVVHQKDLGPDRRRLAPAIVAFDPSSSWAVPEVLALGAAPNTR